MSIEVILTENDPKLGKRGQVVKVSSGHAHNFLIPHKKAVLATPSHLKLFKEEQARSAEKAAEAKAHAEALANKIKNETLTVEVMAGETDKLYGAVTSHEIQRALSAAGTEIDKKAIHLEEPIRKLGNFDIEIKLHPEVNVKLKVSVIKKRS